MEKRILFFLPEDSVRSNGVYRSQILGLASYLVQELNYHVLILSKDRDSKAGEAFKNDLSKKDIEFEFDSCANSKISFIFNEYHFRHFAKKFLQRVRAFAPTHIYARHPQAIHAAKVFKNICNAKLLYSLRGVAPEEKLLEGQTFKNRLSAFLLQKLENRAVMEADELNTVSFEFANYIQKKYKRGSIVLPCCVSDLFLSQKKGNVTRKETFGWDDEQIIIAYCGGTQKWQFFEKICNYMLNLAIRNAKICFLILTKDIKNSQCILQKLGFPHTQYHVLSGSPEEISIYLRLSNFGIILRDASLVNQVASPVKVAEYMASGLGILYGGKLGDYPNLLTTTQIGYDIENGDIHRLIDFLQKRQWDNEWHQKITEICRSKFTWDANKKNIEMIFAD